MLYEDGLIIASLPERPAVKGHVRVRADRDGFGSLSEDDFAHVLSAATFASSALFEQVGAQGTNIICSDVDGVVAEVVARSADDGLSLRWDPLSVDAQEMDALAAKIKDKCDYIGVDRSEKRREAPAPQPKASSEQDSAQDDRPDVKNYLLRKLDRLP